MGREYTARAWPGRLRLLGWSAVVILAVVGLAIPWRTQTGTRYDFDPRSLLVEARSNRAGIDPSRPLSFPEDHGAHPEAAAEIWRFVGNLADDRNGTRYSFQLSFSRYGLGTEVRRTSAWAARQVYGARFRLARHFPPEFLPFERYSRDGLELAGYRAGERRLWLEGWSVALVSQGEHTLFHLHAAERGAFLNLQLSPVKPPFATNAAGTRYYMLSRLQATGVVGIGGERHPVSGIAFFGHGFGNLPPAGGQLAWNRCIVHLNDGRELVTSESRRRDGSGNPIVTGWLVDSEGAATELGSRELKLSSLQTWQSPETGITYPVKWRFTAPRQALDLLIEAVVESQEFAGLEHSWSGGVTVSGTSSGKPVAGSGHAQLTGFGVGTFRN